MANLSNINNKFIVTDGGNVLIGPTGNTSYRLDVGGNIRVPYANGYFMDTTGAAGSNFVKTINDYETVIGTDRGSAGFGVFGNSNIRLGFGTAYTSAQTSLFITSSGRVGIGTVSPVSTWLSGFDPSTGNGTFKLTSEGWIVTPYLTGLAGYYPGQGARPIVWADDSGTNLQCWDNSATDGVSLRSSNGTTRLFVREDGNVGIGTTSPNYLLDLSKTAVAVDTYSGINLQASNYGYTIEGGLTQNIGGELIFSSNSVGTKTPRVKFAANGNVGIGTTTPVYDLVVSNGGASGIEFAINTASGLNEILCYNRSTAAFETLRTQAIKHEWYTNATSNAMVILDNGNVGIGTTSPDSKLEVAAPGAGEFAGPNSSSAGGSHLMLRDEGSTSRTLMSGPSIVFQTPASADGTNIWATSRLLGSPAAAGSARGTFSIQVRDNYDPFNDGTSWNWRTCLTAINNGNVGIGETSPASKLTVRKDSAGGRGGEISIVNYSSVTVGNEAALNFGLESSTYNADNGNAQIKARVNALNAATDMIFSTWNGGAFGERMRIGSTGRINMFGLDAKGTTGSDVRYRTSDGELYYLTSSKRYKTNIVNLESSLDKINALRPVRFKDMKTGEATCGLIAEETFKIIPDVVFTKKIKGFDEPQIEGLNYSDLVPFLIKSIQELKAEIELLKSK